MAVINVVKTAAGILGNKKKRDRALLAAKGVKAVLKTPALTGAVLGGLVFVTDQLFKSSVEMQPEGTFPHDIAENGIGAEVEFDRMHNPGIAMSTFSNAPETAEKLALTGICAAGASLLTRKETDRVGIISDMVVLGGAASNYYDRKKRGYVVDYLHVKKGPLSRIVFNLGDVAIAAGALIGNLNRHGDRT